MKDRITALQGLRVLVVEDEHLVALALTGDLEDAGAIVIGPASSIESAFELIGRHEIAAAVLDIQLHSQMVFPVAEALSGKGVPFLFTTGFDAGVIPDEYAHVPKCAKPASGDTVLEMLVELAANGG